MACYRLRAMAALMCGVAFASQMQAADALPKGNAALGKVVYDAKCSACHSASDNRVGPMHAGVVGRKAGSIKDYDYSPALRTSKLVWTQANLAKWLTDPEAVIPGQRMGYRLGVAGDRADVVAYLATLK
jgi:cytochrome c